MRQVAAHARRRPMSIQSPPTTRWAALFLGEGFDPVDGAQPRERMLSRAKGTLYASVREGGRTLAAGAMSFGHGWASVHGMRTEQSAQRGRGLAGRVLAGLAQAALARGYERVFLQVDAANPPALGVVPPRGFRDPLEVQLLGAIRLAPRLRGTSCPLRLPPTGGNTEGPAEPVPWCFRKKTSTWSGNGLACLEAEAHVVQRLVDQLRAGRRSRASP
jgi:GNAT superfamily N-acetyltransferase